MKITKKLIFLPLKRLLLFILILCISAAPVFSKKQPKTMYKETQDLVSFVHSAVKLIERSGTNCFNNFRKPGSKWYTGKWYDGNKYIFVDEMTGVEVVNPAFPDMENEYIMDSEDAAGRLFVKDYIRKLYRYGIDKNYGWSHYLWPKDGYGPITWKTTYVEKAKAPDETQYVVGASLYDMRMEKAFVVEAVESAVKLLDMQGINALNTIKEKDGQFYYKDTYVFVTNPQGDELANQVFEGIDHADIKEATDLQGNNLFDAYVKIAENGAGWIRFPWQNYRTNEIDYKHTYIEGYTTDDGTLFVVGSTVEFEADAPNVL